MKEIAFRLSVNKNSDWDEEEKVFQHLSKVPSPSKSWVAIQLMAKGLRYEQKEQQLINSVQAQAAMLTGAALPGAIDVPVKEPHKPASVSEAVAQIEQSEDRNKKPVRPEPPTEVTKSMPPPPVNEKTVQELAPETEAEPKKVIETEGDEEADGSPNFGDIPII